MIIYPAIDILGGRCVRLSQGDYEKSTVYSENPADVARQWQEQGAQWIHLVDLDGAKARRSVNLDVVAEVRRTVDVPLQLGGGIRGEAQIKAALSIGVDRVILGTAAVTRPYFLFQMLQKYGDKIAVGLDAKDDKIAISGWQKTRGEDVFKYAKFVEHLGVKTIIFTDIATDGMLSGPNVTAMEQMANGLHIDVIASGGVSCIDDIVRLSKTKVSGVIVGKALYTGNVKLRDAVEIR